MRLIDADELKNKMATFTIYEANSPIAIDMIHIIDECQTIGEDHEKHGKWILFDENKKLWGCSCCHLLSAYPSPYCPECGAKMKGD